MCGIAGIVGQLHSDLARDALRKMIFSMARRGPDGEGMQAWDGACLGHKRLAIFDLSDAGRQPMMTPDRNLGVVFNGAIYNFHSLRSEMEKSGYNFKSNTDTEVLLHGYREWGIEKLVMRLRGMFAFGLWDDKLQRLYLVRDRLGVKPLVFAESGGLIAFASTVRALRAGGFASDLDEGAIATFLTKGFVIDDRSIYKGVRKVPPATIMEWADGKLRQKCYWKRPEASDSSTLSFRDIVGEAEQLFLDAVAVRLHADVPVGLLLSGGIDSSLVCWAARKLGCNARAYTISTPGDPADEGKAAAETARAIGIEHRVLEMSADEIPEIGELVSAYAEPFASGSALGMLRLSRAIAPFAKVLLTGDGGDDVFLGYPRHRHLWLAEKVMHMGPLAPVNWWPAVRDAIPRTGFFRRPASFLNYATGDLSAFTRNDAALLANWASGILGDRLLDFGTDHDEISSGAETGNGLLASFMVYEQKTRFLGEYLTKVDGATMHYGLEARSPLLDQRLWEFASALPFNSRLHRGQLKAVLRKLACKKIGIRTATRRKRGFTVPVQRWLVNGWRKSAEALFHDSVLEKEGWIQPGAVLGELESVRKGDPAPVQLWYLFVLENWIRYENGHSASDR